LDTLKRFDEDGKKVDYVINDLTEYPVSKEVTGYSYDFQTCFTLMELSLKILKPNGRLFARVF
jgi:23S rRNA U2552 (ribose-2'-O)-methylase RlmE/FtsJ